MDDLEGSRFVTTKLAKHDPIMRAIRDPAFASHLALRLAELQAPVPAARASHARHSRAHGCV